MGHNTHKCTHNNFTLTCESFYIFKSVSCQELRMTDTTLNPSCGWRHNSKPDASRHPSQESNHDSDTTLLGVNSNFKCYSKINLPLFVQIKQSQYQNKIKQPTNTTPRFFCGEPSNAKVKITGPSLVKSSTINNNEITIVFPIEISRGNHHIKNTCILGLNINSLP